MKFLTGPILSPFSYPLVPFLAHVPYIRGKKYADEIITLLSLSLFVSLQFLNPSIYLHEI